MSDVSEIITIGVGTPAEIKFFITVGLSLGEAVPAPAGDSLLTAVTTLISANTAYALPTKCKRIEWQVQSTAILSASLDGSHFVAIDTSSGAQVRVIDVAATFIKCNHEAFITCRAQRF